MRIFHSQHEKPNSLHVLLPLHRFEINSCLEFPMELTLVRMTTKRTEIAFPVNGEHFTRLGTEELEYFAFEAIQLADYGKLILKVARNLAIASKFAVNECNYLIRN